MLLAALLTAAACEDTHDHPAFRGAGTSQPRRGGTLRWAVDSDVRSLDPHVAYDSVSSAVVHHLFDTLVAYAPGRVEFVPALAERWEQSEDGRSFTFYLRHGVRFHHGRELVAEDVQRSFERMLDPQRVPCPNTAAYALIEGFDDFQSHRAPHLAGLTVLDRYTVRFRLRQADQTFLNAMVLPFAAPIPVEVAESVGRDAFGQQPVGTGPFRLERWEMGAGLTLTRHREYWQQGRPYLDRMVVETGLSQQLQFMRFQRGELEHLAAGSLRSSDLLWLRNRPAWRPYMLNAPQAAIYGVCMNVEMPPWNNRHLRRAVAFAIDRDRLERVRFHRVRALGGLLPPVIPGFDPNLPNAQRFDLRRAREEMRLAGFADGVPGEQDLWTTEGAAGLDYAELLQQDLAQLGIRVRIHQASFAEFLNTTQRRHAVGLSLGGWVMDFPDPANFVETLFHSRAIQEENSVNTSFYSNPTLDAVLDRARIEPDRERRLDLYRQAERIVVDDAPWAFQVYTVNDEVMQPWVRNYVIDPVNDPDFREVWLDLPLRAW